jgi:hypothetical protein
MFSGNSANFNTFSPFDMGQLTFTIAERSYKDRTITIPHKDHCDQLNISVEFSCLRLASEASVYEGGKRRRIHYEDKTEDKKRRDSEDRN